MRTAFAAALFVLLLAPAARGSGPSYVSEGWDGVAARAGGIRYVALPAGLSTTLAVVRKDGGRVVSFATIPGRWGIPSVTLRGRGAGLTRDGKWLVLGDAQVQTSALRPRSRFTVVDTKLLQQWTTIVLRGDFAFDALSPDGRTLYLVQHVPPATQSSYVVRAYDLRRERLLPGRISDPRQRGWVMAGNPVARASSPGGRFVYTLYARDNGTPFVHMLDASGRSAVCVGVPWAWTKSQDELSTSVMRYRGGVLTIAGRNGRGTTVRLDTATRRWLGPAAGGFPTTPVAASAAGLGALLGLLLALGLRRKAQLERRALARHGGDGDPAAV
jgi:hypothetical protein